MPPLTRQRLAHVAFLYYVQDCSQAEIARRLAVTRSNVSRMLRAAREQRIVRFEIDVPAIRDHDLESRLELAFIDHPIREFIVAVSDGFDDRDDVDTAGFLPVCRVAADRLAADLRDGLAVGVSWGQTTQGVVDALRVERRSDVQAVALEASVDPRSTGQDLVRDLAQKVGGRHTYFSAPAVATNEAAAVLMMEAPMVAEALQLARSVDVAVIGIGQFNVGSSREFLEAAAATQQELQEADRAGVEGQICGRYFDQDGEAVELALSKRIICLELSDIRELPTVIAAASGSKKAPAVTAAIRGGLVDVLVIDDRLARAVLQYEAERKDVDDRQQGGAHRVDRGPTPRATPGNEEG